MIGPSVSAWTSPAPSSPSPAYFVDPGIGSVATGELQASDQIMDVAAIRGFDPSPGFYQAFHMMALRSSVVGVVVREDRSYIANDVDADPYSVGRPEGHPAVQKFLGVPLRRGGSVIGMIGVANKPGGYGENDERLLATFAGQVAVAVEKRGCTNANAK